LVKSSWGLAHPMSLTELALLDSRRPLTLWDVIGRIKKKENNRPVTDSVIMLICVGLNVECSFITMHSSCVRLHMSDRIYAYSSARYE
jgi:hypothetical protein